MERLCEELLGEWCETLLRLQITETGNRRLDGAILCPACGRIHGRCLEAAYPFMYMGSVTGDEKWICAAENLYEWAEYTLSQADGSYLNDIDSSWKGTTVFNLTQMADCLIHHGDKMPKSMKQKWKIRMRKGAEFLCGFSGLRKNNINYPLSESLALYELGMVLEEERYLKQAKELAAMAEQVLTENGLIFGEGIPHEKKSPRGCHSVDIGYNIEETLPSLALYAVQSGDEKVRELAKKSLKAHLAFLLPDGGWDNSFGTRNFKWTYWGSRTSDGCVLGYLLFAEEPEFAQAAKKNLELLKKCTVGGLLAGGPHYEAAGQKPCVHHTFTHAKVLAGILDRGLLNRTTESVEGDSAFSFPHQHKQEKTCMKYYPELDIIVVKKSRIRATVTSYDWEYLQGGHVSGGTLSLLYHHTVGPLLCAGMGQYARHEPPNMQTPQQVRHECLAPRIEAWEEGVLYSSIYETRGQMEIAGDSVITVRGNLKDIRHQDAPGRNLPYLIRYCFGDDGITVHADFFAGTFICPVISRQDEEITWNQEKGRVEIAKDGSIVVFETEGDFDLPYGTERIFNLVPGFQALKLEMKPVNQKVSFVLRAEML